MEEEEQDSGRDAVIWLAHNLATKLLAERISGKPCHDDITQASAMRTAGVARGTSFTAMNETSHADLYVVGNAA